MAQSMDTVSHQEVYVSIVSVDSTSCSIPMNTFATMFCIDRASQCTTANPTVVGLDAYRPRLIKLCQSLSKSIGDYGDDRIEMNAFMGRFAFDFMGEVLLGEDFGLIRSGSMHPVMESRDRALSLFGHLGGAVWIANLAFKMLPFHSAVKDWFHLIDFCDEQIIKRKQVQVCFRPR